MAVAAHLNAFSVEAAPDSLLAILHESTTYNVSRDGDGGGENSLLSFSWTLLCCKRLIPNAVDRLPYWAPHSTRSLWRDASFFDR